MSVNSSLVIVGCGGHARSIADVALNNGYKTLVFVDEEAREDEKFFGFNVVSDFSILRNEKNILFGIGDNVRRENYYARFSNVFSLISKDAYIGIDSIIENGVFVGHNAHVGPMTKIGENTIINTHAIVEHECTIGSHSHVSVNSVVAGRCNIGSLVFIGAGAIIKDGVNICSNVTVGAGAVVVKDICESGVYVGSPVKKIK